MNLLELTDPERCQLQEQLHGTDDARVYRRTLALLLIDSGEEVEEVAQMLQVHRSNVYRWIDAFAAERDPAALADKPGRGRPGQWTAKQQSMLRSLLNRSPQQLGYASSQWTIRLLQHHLREQDIAACSASSLRRQLQVLGYTWKRARHVLEEDPEKEKKTADPAATEASSAPQCSAV